MALTASQEPHTQMARHASRPDGAETSIVRGVMALAAIAIGTAAAAQTFSLSSLEDRAVRSCRSIIAVVNPAASSLDITTTLRIGEANAIAISYVAKPASGLPKSRKLVCSFKDKGGTFNRSRELVNVVVDGTQLGPARMRFLQRFWLGSRDADEAAALLDQPKKR